MSASMAHLAHELLLHLIRHLAEVNPERLANLLPGRDSEESSGDLRWLLWSSVPEAAADGVRAEREQRGIVPDFRDSSRIGLVPLNENLPIYRTTVRRRI